MDTLTTCPDSGKKRASRIGGGVRHWRKLETVGDIKRMLRWCVWCVKMELLTPDRARTMGYLGGLMLKAIELGELEKEAAKAQEMIQRLMAKVEELEEQRLYGRRLQ